MSIHRSGAVRPGKALAPALLLALGAALAGTLAGCGSDEPVGRLVAQPAALRLAYPRPVPLRLTWTPLAPVETEGGKPLLVFVHLLSGPRQVVRTFDHPFPRPWTPGRPVSYDLDLGQSALAPPIPPGHYQLTVGLYDGGRERWPLMSGQEVARREYAVAEIDVPALRSPAPSFQFSPNWGEPERTGDSQTVMRRWIDEPSTLTVAGAPQAGLVRLTVRIPEVQQQGGERLLLDPGFERPTVTVTSTCDGTDARAEGFGARKLEVRVAPGQSCQIAFAPHFKVARVDTVAPRSPAFLEELLWKPEAPAPAPAR